MTTEKTYQEWVTLWVSCHGPQHSRTHPTVMEWAKHMEYMLGPDNCKGFILKTHESYMRGMYLSDNGDFVPFPKNAKLCTWGDAAVRITNSKTLEAIRVNEKGVAIDSRGNFVGLIDE